MKFKPQDSTLGRRFFRLSLLVAALLIVVISLIQVFISYQEKLHSVQETFTDIRNTEVKGISTALWNFSLPELEALTDGIANHPLITYVEIRETSQNVLYSAGREKLTQNVIEDAIPLVYESNGVKTSIGTLLVQVDRSKIWETLWDDIVEVLIFRIVTILVMIFLFVFLIDHQITRYLHYVSEILQNYDLSHLEIPLKIDKPDNNDEIDQLVHAFNDMRQRVLFANRQQNESERKFATLLGNLPGMAYRCKYDLNWTMEVVSAGCYSLTGYQPDDLIENNVISYSQIIYFEDRDMVWNSIHSQIANSQSFEISYRIVTKSGSMRWVWERGSVIYSEDHSISAIEGFISDITEKKQQERELEAIASMSYAIRSAETSKATLTIIMEQTTSLLSTDGCMIELIEPETGGSVIQVANGIYVNAVGSHIPEGKGLNTYIRETLKPYLNNDAIDDPRVYLTEIIKKSPAVCGAPLIAQDELIGFLWIGRTDEISNRVVSVLTAIADIAANAIHRIRLFQQTEKNLKQLIGLRKIDNAINSNVGLSNTLDVVLQQTITLLDGNAAQIIDYNAESNMVTYLAAVGIDIPTTQKTSLLDRNSLIGRAIDEHKTIRIEDVHESDLPVNFRAWMQIHGFVSVFTAPLIVKTDLRGVLQIFFKKAFHPDQDWIDYFETLAGQTAIAINEASLWQNLQQSNMELIQAYDETLAGWSNALDLRDHETEDHTRRVTELTLRLAKMLGIDGDDLVDIRRGALLHDIGKMGVPDNILTKPGRLTAEEWEIMRKHPVFAYTLLSPIKFLRKSLDIPYCHHEKWDGTGYPRGLKGEEIPLAARIFAVVDVWDAMTSDRYYRAAMSKKEAADYILANSGKHFDPMVVEVFKTILEE